MAEGSARRFRRRAWWFAVIGELAGITSPMNKAGQAAVSSMSGSTLPILTERNLRQRLTESSGECAA